MIINGNRVRELHFERGYTAETWQMIGLPKQAISLVECNWQNLELRNFVIVQRSRSAPMNCRTEHR